MVSGTLDPLYTVFGLKLGCSGAAALIRTKSCKMGRFSIRLGLRTAWLALGPSRGEWTDGRTDGQMDGRKISPFYRTSSPIGAAAQNTERQSLREKQKETVKVKPC